MKKIALVLICSLVASGAVLLAQEHKPAPAQAAAEKAKAEKPAAEKSAHEKAAPEKAPAEKNTHEKAAPEKAPAEKNAHEKAAPAKPAADKPAPVRAASAESAAERILKRLDEAFPKSTAPAPAAPRTGGSNGAASGHATGTRPSSNASHRLTLNWRMSLQWPVALAPAQRLPLVWPQEIAPVRQVK